MELWNPGKPMPKASLPQTEVIESKSPATNMYPNTYDKVHLSNILDHTEGPPDVLVALCAGSITTSLRLPKAKVRAAQ